METALSADHVTTMAAANRYLVTPDLLRRWREKKGFPDAAVERRGQYTFWHLPSIDAWLLERLELKERLTYGTGPKPRWADLVRSFANDARSAQ